MATLPQSADEFTGWIIGFLPEAIQPYAGFVIAAFVVIVGAITFFQPIVSMFRKKEDPGYQASTGDASLDALLMLDARGSLSAPDRNQLTSALLLRISGAEPIGSEASGVGANQARREVVDRLVDAPSSPEKTERLETFLSDPRGGVADMMEQAQTTEDYLDVGKLASGFDVALAQQAFNLAMALEPDNLDARYHLLSLASAAGGMADFIAGFEELLSDTERVRPDLTAMILLKLARYANFKDQWDDAQRQYKRAISIAEATHDKDGLAAACHAVADDILSPYQSVTADPDLVPEWRLEEAEAMLDKAAEAISACEEDLPRARIDQALGRAALCQARAQYEPAEQFINEALMPIREMSLSRLEAQALALLAIVLRRKGERFKAIDTIQEAIDLTTSVFENAGVDGRIASARFFWIKGDLLQDMAGYDDALEAYEAAYAAYEASNGFDEYTRNMLQIAMSHCRQVTGNSSDESDEAAAYDAFIAEDDDDGTETEVFDLEARMRETERAAAAGLLKEADEASGDEATGVFSDNESEDFDDALRLYTEGQRRIDSEDYSGARRVLLRAKETFEALDALAPETEEEIDRLIGLCDQQLN